MPVAVALVFTLSVGGGFGVAIGASIDDFRRGLVYGGAIGAVVGGLIYAFALRDR